MAQKKTGFSNTNFVQADKLLINNGLTSSINFTFVGGSTLTFSLPTTNGSNGWAIITDGNGNLTFGTVSGAGNVNGTGTAPKHAYWSATNSLASSLLEEGSGQLLFPAGTTAAPGISFILDGDTGFRRSNTNQLTAVAGGQDIATFKSGGVQVGQVFYTNTDGPANYVLATDGSGNTLWVENIIGATGATGAYIVSGNLVNPNQLIFTLNTGATVSASGTFSGTSGQSGTAGTSGQTGTSGTRGTSGTSGGAGAAGATGTSGSAGTSGTSGQTFGTSGSSGQTGTSGTSGQTGTSGTSGQTGSAGTSGTRGTSGTSGQSGTVGTSGSSGQTGTAGTSGQTGTAGTSGQTGTSGSSGNNGTSGSSGAVGATGSIGAQLVDGWLNSASYSTQIIALTNSNNWTIGNTFSGSISSTYQGQRYFASPYFYDAIDDNQWVRKNITNQYESGSFLTPSITFVNDVDTGIFNAGANQVAISAGGATAATFYNAGVNSPMYSSNVAINTSVSGTFTQSLASSNNYAYTLTGNTTFNYSSATTSVYNFVIKAGTYSFTLGTPSNWQTVGATGLGFTGSFVMSAIYDGTDMWIATTKNYQSY